MAHLGKTQEWEDLEIGVDSEEVVEDLGAVVTGDGVGDTEAVEGDSEGATEAEEETLEVVAVGGSEGDLEEGSGEAEGDIKTKWKTLFWSIVKIVCNMSLVVRKPSFATCDMAWVFLSFFHAHLN